MGFLLTVTGLILQAAVVSTVLAAWELYETKTAKTTVNDYLLAFVEPFVILVILIFNAIVGVLQVPNHDDEGSDDEGGGGGRLLLATAVAAGCCWRR